MPVNITSVLEYFLDMTSNNSISAATTAIVKTPLFSNLKYNPKS